MQMYKDLMNDDLYEHFKDLLTGDALSPERKDELSREILEILFGEEK